MSRLSAACAVALAVGLSGAADALAPSGADALTRLSRIAELYRDTALHFTCHEEIDYHGDRSGRIAFAYIFVHEKDGRLHDYRTWPSRTTASTRGEEVRPDEYLVPRFLENAYLWPFVFLRERLPLHSYFRLGEDVALGRPAIKIGFQPKGKIRKGENDWAGVVSVDRETSQILQVEAWTIENWNARAKREADLEAAKSRGSRWESDWYDIETVTTEFSEIKNGLRFPGKITIVRTRSKVRGGERDFPLVEHELLRVNQIYTAYEFFSVRSSEEIRGFVDTGAALDSR